MTINGETALLQKVIFEIRYRYGFRYLDVCGSTLNTIQKELKEWVLPGDPNPQSGSLVSLANGCLMSFSAYLVNLSLEKPLGEGPLSEEDYMAFLRQIDTVPEIIIDKLGVTEFSHLGFRTLYLFPKKSMEQSEKWLQDLGAYSFSDPLISAFGGKIEATSAIITIFGSSARYRIAFAGVERQAQMDFGQGVLNVQARKLPKEQQEHLRKQMDAKKRMRQNPEFAVQLDVDCTIDDPIKIETSRFVRDCTAEYEEKLQKSIGKGRV